ncbi:DinB family protein [Stratiformator vulcanicus]|uniref:DinB superfamily protein n=1 Tax=Stratiformator vulcanicus TaxID=2527980 RepID=A0A517R040_9PLAN|nr:DinB family protein [Stratiformator vulcanicus]QDT37265.1 DinB superfamily protein [Stratiformator vulcanicus]
MTFVEMILSQWELNRSRTLDLLKRAREATGGDQALSWQPGPGRAPIGWHLGHIAVTEELFATARLADRPSDLGPLIERFRGGSVADSNVPTADELERLLEQTRSNLLQTVESIEEKDLETVPPALAERQWTVRKSLQILSWHEPQHQGQAHAVLNLFLNDPEQTR